MTINTTTPQYDDSYPSCLETRVSLLIYPGDFAPSQVTELLGIQPSEARTAGSIRKNSDGKEFMQKISVWFLSSEAIIESKDMRRHLDWLLDVLEPSQEKLKELQKQVGLEMRIGCVWISKAGHGGPTLLPEHMQRMSSLNLECSFDIYFSSTE